MKNNKFEVIDGIVENLEIFDAEVNFLESADKNSRIAGAVATIQAAFGEPGAVNSSQAASDNGEQVESFTMNVGDTLVRGSFWKTTFKNGEAVQVIGTRRKNFFHAVAVVNLAGRVIWMPPHCERGTAAQKRYISKMSTLAVIGIFILLCALFTGKNTPFWFYLVCSSFVSALFILVTVVMSWGDFMTFANQVDGVGAALKIPSPENINLSKSTKLMRQQGKPDLPLGVYYY